MKKYSVKCFLTCSEGERPSSIVVEAADRTDARQIALKALREKGYNNAILLPDVPGMEWYTVQEL